MIKDMSKGECGVMTLIHRFIRWINSRSFVIRRRSTSSVSPSNPVSSNSVYKSDVSSAYASNSSSTKQVHFADDYGEQLECVYKIPHEVSRGTFDESLEEVYIDKHGRVTGFLKITNLTVGRNIFVKYTLNEWQTNTTVPTEYVPTKRKKWETKPENQNIAWDYDSCTSTHQYEDQNTLTYSFSFVIGRMKANQVKLVIISTFDGVIDQRHDKSYSLNYPRRNARTATNGDAR